MAAIVYTVCEADGHTYIFRYTDDVNGRMRAVHKARRWAVDHRVPLSADDAQGILNSIKEDLPDVENTDDLD